MQREQGKSKNRAKLFVRKTIMLHTKQRSYHIGISKSLR
ncbi:uncharacterized protein Thert_02009 [Thermoanaerobacterium thermosaccharolyticum]|uniref:Uncharacterized protein n=1 Tax=Thermoanaerobacterium thermosaccharolyticum TaxID=1517 RepID=A0A223HZT7_THETR|nr:uncharacterized protein Thert_02009 [Thermoanaerobacterium thermosaccharolyticum]